MNIRAVCRIIGQATGAPDAVRWAARLRQADMLPPSKDELNDKDVARLLVAIMAARRPEDATAVIERIEALPFCPPVPVHPALVPLVDQALPALLLNPVAKTAMEIMFRANGPSPHDVFILDIQEGGFAAQIITASKGWSALGSHSAWGDVGCIGFTRWARADATVLDMLAAGQRGNIVQFPVRAEQTSMSVH